MKRGLLTLATGVVCTAVASAQFLAIGVDDAAQGIYIYDTNNITASPTNVNLGVDVWGMAADNATSTLYTNDGSTLTWFDFNTWTQKGTIGITDAAGASLSFVSLSFNQQTGTLYGTRNIGDEAVYKIDTTTGVASVVFSYTNADFDFGGTDIDPVTGKMYGTNDDSSPQRGLYEIDYNGGITTFITDYPAGETDIDGLAVGYGKAYLIEDDATATGSIHIYDFASGTYDNPIATPWATSEVFSAGTLFDPVPEPATMFGIGTLALLAFRRRRKQK